MGLEVFQNWMEIKRVPILCKQSVSKKRIWIYCFICLCGVLGTCFFLHLTLLNIETKRVASVSQVYRFGFGKSQSFCMAFVGKSTPRAISAVYIYIYQTFKICNISKIRLKFPAFWISITSISLLINWEIRDSSFRGLTYWAIEEYAKVLNVCLYTLRNTRKFFSLAYIEEYVKVLFVSLYTPKFFSSTLSWSAVMIVKFVHQVFQFVGWPRKGLRTEYLHFKKYTPAATLHFKMPCSP